MNTSKFNYHVKKLENGEKQYFVKAEGQWIKVEKEIHNLLTSTDRRQRQIDMLNAQHGCISIDAVKELMSTDDRSGYLPAALTVQSVEDDYIENEDRLKREKKIKEVLAVLKSYPKSEQFIIYGYYIKGLKIADIAKRLNIAPKTVYKRKAAILKKLYCDCNGGEM